ncbi:M15 family metallopeptidase [Chloroflexia bacterium SDU3-3]|nr:M15 family metallopeptidase [Chloroflexia bacterium SDU3-3]
MRYSESKPTAHRLPPALVVALLVAALAVGAGLGFQLLASSPRPSAPPRSTPAPPSQQPQQQAAAEPATPTAAPRSTPAPPQQAAAEPALPALPADIPPRELPGVLGEADGILPDVTTAFDQVAGVERLDPALLDALRQASADAADDELVIHITSGWRSPAYQRQLLREAVAQYGSEQEAARWVATAATSPHVAGQAVDVGPYAAMDWLAQHGSAYGLCQIYGNEPWHYELRPEAAQQGCPPMYADPTHDPRMQ